MSATYLTQIERVDTFPYEGIGDYFTLSTHDGTNCIGYITESIALLLSKEDLINIDLEKKNVTLSESLDSFEKRNSFFKSLGTRWKLESKYSEALQKGWRNELYTVYAPTGTPYFLVERALSVFLGIVTYGVHVNGFVPPNKSSTSKLKLWIPQRSQTKPTYPGMLDNMVGGGLGFPYGVAETLVKESFEEAGLSKAFVEKYAKSVGVVSYMYQPDGKSGNVQPEVEFIYDLEFPDEDTVVPVPQDGEAENFKLMDVDVVLSNVELGKFKPNTVIVILDFLIRNGYINLENEPNLLSIISRCHRNLPFPTI